MNSAIEQYGIMPAGATQVFPGDAQQREHVSLSGLVREDRSASPLRVLLLEKLPVEGELTLQELERSLIPFTATRVATKKKYLKELEEFWPDIILAEYTLSDMSGLDALRIKNDVRPEIPFILVTNPQKEAVAAECLKQGADDYILKSSLRRLSSSMVNALQRREELRQRDQLGRRLQKSTAQMVEIFESIRDSFFAVDHDWKIWFLNRSSDSLLHKMQAQRENLLDCTWWQIFPIAEGSHGWSELHRAMAERTTVEFEEYFAGMGLWLSIKGYPSDTGLSLYVHDITEGKQTAERVALQEELLNNAKDAIMVRDVHGTLLYWNEGARRLYGWSPHEVIGKQVDSFLYNNIEAIIQLTEVVKDLGRWSGELRQRTKSGTEVVVESRWIAIQNDGTKPDAVLIIETDISEKKNLEQQFLRSQRLEAIGLLTGGIVHDLNNVLTPIVMAIPMLKRMMNDPQGNAMLEVLNAVARRGEKILKQILSFSRGSADERNLIQLKHLVTETAFFLRETFPPAIRVETHFPRVPASVTGNPTQLFQVLMNLCINARDAMPLGGVLQINVDHTSFEETTSLGDEVIGLGRFIRIDVIDSGNGIKTEDVPHIFEPFYTTKQADQGTGLGLFTVKNIIQNHGGTIRVKSTPGAGSIFSLYLPEEAPSTTETPEAAPDSVDGRGATILVADDETGLASLVQSALEQWNFNVITATDGADALAKYVQNQEIIKAVVLDRLMPAMDGETAARAILRVNPSAVVILSSGVDREQSSDDPLPFIQKPYDAIRLAMMLDQMIHHTTKKFS